MASVEMAQATLASSFFIVNTTTIRLKSYSLKSPWVSAISRTPQLNNCQPTNFFLAGGGLSSAIFERQSSCVVCGPVTKVPLTLVLYQPDTTPRRSDSSVLTWRAERICMEVPLQPGARKSAQTPCGPRNAPFKGE